MGALSRRNFLVAGAAVLGASALAGGVGWYRARRAPHASTENDVHEAGSFPNALLLPGSSGVLGVLDGSAPFTIVAKAAQHAILKGKPAPLLVYQVEQAGTTWINPLLRVRSGATVRARLENALEEHTIIHWHGLKVDSRNDAHPVNLISADAGHDYDFAVTNRAGTYWYHPHPPRLTARQAYLGLASFFIVEDDEEFALQKALDLRLGVTDIPLVIQDKKFDERGGLVYTPSSEEDLYGYVGDTALVNLTPRPFLNAASRIYRFRILNGSNARIYRLAFTRGGFRLLYAVIGTDGGLLDRPYPVKETFLAPGERLDVLLDLSGASVGTAATLQSLAFDPMRAGGSMTGIAMGDPAPASAPDGVMLADGAAIDLLRINVTSKTAYGQRVPAVLSAQPPVNPADAKPREFLLDLKAGRWRINGETFDPRKTPVTVRRGAKEIWEIRNDKASSPHPMHLQGVPFRVLSRSGSPQQLTPGIVTDQGLTVADLGWKDTVLLWPGETVRLAVDFSHPYAGDQVYLFHCSNLERKDRGMMINVGVRG